MALEPHTTETRPEVSLPRRWTYDELVAELPESNQPCELWDGELVMSPTPSFEHQKITLRLYRAFDDWVSSRRLGQVVTAPLDMVLSPHRVAQPDLVFIAQDRLSIIQRVIRGPADLVAEVISLGGRHRDRIEKRDLYEQHGIKEYWIIDPESRTIDVLFLKKSRYQLLARSGPGTVAKSHLLPGFEVAVDGVFRDVQGGV
jgi:Uma2 family endonuclease